MVEKKFFLISHSIIGELTIIHTSEKWIKKNDFQLKSFLS
jgi:hypothetical protein